MTLTRELTELAHRAAQANSPGMRLLAPGLPRADVERQLRDHFGWSPPDELVEWFCWQNGYGESGAQSRPGGSNGVLIGWRPYSLEKALDAYREQTLGRFVPKELEQSEGWLELMDHESADYSLYATAQPGVPTVRLMRWSKAMFMELVDESLEAMIRVWNRAFEHGLHYDADGDAWRAHDDQAYMDQVGRHNAIT